MKRVVVNGRWPLMVPDHQVQVWSRPAGWEVERLAAMSELIGPDSTVFYVGAERGDMPALLASWGARVAMVEPGVQVWGTIRATWEANSLPDPAACLQGFAYDVDRLSAHTSLTGWPAPVCEVDEHGFRNFIERPEQDAIRLDTLATRTGLVPTDVSIDVEGSEWPVLRGAEQLMAEHRPRLWVSIHPTSMWTLLQEDATEMNRWIRQRGYRVELLSWRHEMHTLYTPLEAS